MPLPEQTQKILDAALFLRKVGISPIFTDHKTKKPLGAWKKAQEEIYSEEKLREIARRLKPQAVAAVCGKVSGGLLVFDFDVDGYYEKWSEKIGVPYAKSFLTQTTGGGGKQVFVRCPDPGRNDKLAWHPNEDEVSGREIAIETRGEGGYVIVPPSFHPSGGVYEWDITCKKKISKVTQDQAGALIRAAQDVCGAPDTKNEVSAKQEAFNKAKKKRRKNGKDVLDVIGKFNSANNIRDMLERNGYLKFRGTSMYIRPGGKSSSVLVDDQTQESFHFSTNDPLNSDHRRDAFDVFLQHECNGDMTTAIKTAALSLGIELPTKAEKQQKVIEAGDDLLSNATFTPIGHNRGTFYYLSHKTYQIVQAQTGGHTKLFLLSLANITFWENNFALDRKGVDWDVAANTLFNACYRRGIFDTRAVRGRGAWRDEERIVVHEGKHLIVDNKKTRISQLDTEYIYEADVSLQLTNGKPLTWKDTQPLYNCIDMLAWENPLHAKLFAGWLFLAPICGSLRWRPHIWLTGSKGSGKTTVVEQIAKKVLGKCALSCLATTTEAGIRQILGYSALPIIFDEIDTNTKRDQERAMRVLELMRQASSETDMGIIKGSASGKAMEYRVRSMFCLSSTKTHIEQAADASRISVLSLTKHGIPDRKSKWKEISKLINYVKREPFPSGFRGRAIQCIPQITENIEIFADAFAELYDQRTGDQLGAMAAGCWNGYFSDSVVSEQFARDWIGKHEWKNESVLDYVTDEIKCLRMIMEARIVVSDEKKRLERNIDELIWVSSTEKESAVLETGVDVKLAEQTLLRHGIRADTDMIYISHSHNALKRILERTAYPNRWKDLLRRLPGAVEKASVRFGVNRYRCVGIPFDTIFGGHDDNKDDGTGLSPNFYGDEDNDTESDANVFPE